MSRWLLVALAVVALTVAGVGYWWFHRKVTPPPTPPLAAIPADAVPAGVALYASVRVAELWDSPLFAKLRDTKGAANADALTKRLGLLGVDAAALDRVTVVAHADPKLPVAVAATGRKSFDLGAVAG